MKTNTIPETKANSLSKNSAPGPNLDGITIGIDLGDKKHRICAMTGDGDIIDERNITNNREALLRLSRKHPGARIVMEVGTHSPWISRLFDQRKHQVIVANARKLRAIYENDRKSDTFDARMLAMLGRVEPRLLHPVDHQCEEAQRDLLQIKLRDTLVAHRGSAITAVRSALKSLGQRLPASGTAAFADAARAALAGEPELLEMVGATLEVLDLQSAKIKVLDKEIERLGEEKYPQTKLLRQVAGVEPITALTFVLTIGDPVRFANSRDVGSYLGLVPKRDQSGNVDKEMRISKAGNSYLRRLLVGAAQYILGPFGPECDLRTHGLKLAARGGRSAKKKAVVATARKLAVLLHALWTSGSDYRPLRDAA